MQESDTRTDPPTDDGFTMIEVIVAFVVLLVFMAAMGPFFVRSFVLVGQHRGQQAAIEIANTAVGQIRALQGSALLAGRGQQASTTQWQNAYDTGPTAIKSFLAVPGRTIPSTVTRKLTMKLAWDTDKGSKTVTTDGATAPISTSPLTTTVQGVTYKREIFVGLCDVYLTNVPGYVVSLSDNTCVNPDIVAPPADSTKDLQFFRAVVLVTWAHKGCTANLCTHVASTLVSRTNDPEFDFNRPSPVINPGQVATFYVNRAGTYRLEVAGGQLPNTWSLTSGTMPAGLSLSAAGVLSGTATATVSRTLTLKVVDKKSRSQSENITVTVVSAPTVTVPVNPRHHVGDAVTQSVTATGGMTPYFSYTATNLPPGLTMNKDTGAITGTLTTAGSYLVTVQVADLNGAIGTATYTHVVHPAVQLAAITDRTFTLPAAVSVTAAGQGGDGSYTYSATGLPPGVIINAGTGVISGVATVPGSYLPTITVKDSLNDTDTGTFTLTVRSTTLLSLVSPGAQTTTTGTAVSLPVTGNAGLLNLTPSYSVTGLPTGLTLNPASGTISGTPTTPGAYKVTVTGTSAAQTSVATFLWTIQ